jgi:hypothetical protein
VKVALESFFFTVYLQMMFMEEPVVMVAGIGSLKEVLNSEFQSIVVQGSSTGSKLFGNYNLMLCQDSDEQNYFCHLMAEAPAPAAVDKAIPSLHPGCCLKIDYRPQR